MRLAVLADIHGNYYALKECIEYILKDNDIYGFIFLGDYCTDFIQWHKVIELIKNIQKNYKTYAIKGNRDDIVIKYHNNVDKYNWNYNNTNGINLVGYNGLTKSDFEYINQLPDNMIIDIPQTDELFLSHDTPDDKTMGKIKEDKISNILIGHSHVNEEFYQAGIHIMNPGSVGMTDLGKIGATFGIIDWDNEKWNFTTKTIPYDYKSTISEITNCKLISDEALIWGHFLIASVITGYSMTPIYVMEFYRLGKIYMDSKEINTIPNYSPAYSKDITRIYKLIEDYINPDILPRQLWKIAANNMDYYLQNDFQICILQLKKT